MLLSYRAWFYILSCVMLVYLLTIPTTREYTVHNISRLNVPTNKRVVQITNWLYNNAGTTQGRCASAAFHDRANRETDWRVKVSNTGYCSTTATYKTIYQGLDAVFNQFTRDKCRTCCASVSRGGKWRGELLATTDGSDPWWMDCSEVDSFFQCKDNEHGDAVCVNMNDVHDDIN